MSSLTINNLEIQITSRLVIKMLGLWNLKTALEIAKRVVKHFEERLKLVEPEM